MVNARFVTLRFMVSFKRRNLPPESIRDKNLANLKKIFTKADIILIISLLLFSGLFLWGFKKNFSEKEIEINHQNILIYKESLNQNKIIEIENGIVIEIKSGKVRMKESNCKKQICVKQGWNDVFPIICVPNEVSIVIKKRKQDILITR